MALRKAYCMECGKETEYEIQKMTSRHKVKEKEYTFHTLTAHCKECGEEISIPGFLDQNMKQEDEQLRREENLVTIDEIYQLMELYHIGKAPLSLALGFGEITIPRYLDGQLPSKAYSEIIRHALCSPEYMERLLKRNQDKLANTAYEKAYQAIQGYRKKCRISSELMQIVSYLLMRHSDLSFMELNCMLYFIQGFYLAFYGKVLFPEFPEATKNGPVYAVLEVFFEDFRYDFIKDSKYYFIKEQYMGIEDNVEVICKLVLQGIGHFSSAYLKKCIFQERPFLNARSGLDLQDDYHFTIDKEDMQKYFTWIVQKFKIVSASDVERYVRFKADGDQLYEQAKSQSYLNV